MVYKDSQLKALRNALNSYREDVGSGRRLTWSSIAAAINEQQGCNINPKYLSKFAMGTAHRDPKEKRKGMRAYQSSLPNNEEIHVAAFFGIKDEGEEIFNKDSFLDDGNYEIWPDSLSNYLNAEGTTNHALNLDLLHGIYRMHWDEEDSLLLLLEPDSDKRKLRFRIFSGHLHIDSLALSLHQSSGWVVPTTDDNLIFIGRDVNQSQETVSFITLAFDSRLRQGETPERLLLKRHAVPVDTHTMSYRSSIPKDVLKLIQEDEVCALWDVRFQKKLEYGNKIR